MEQPAHDLSDVIVVGGGPAGSSASLALGRSRRSVLVIDAGHPRNEPAAHMHGVLGHDGLPPGEYLALGRAEVAGYGVAFVEASAIGARRRDDGLFDVDLDDGTTRTARRLLVASGVTDQLPDIPHLRERWGIDVIHCPYCHGWEVRDTTIGVIATGPTAVHQAMLFRQLTDDVTVFVHSGDGPTAEESARLHARGMRVVAGPVTEVVVSDDRISGLRVGDDTFPVDNVVVAPYMAVRSPVLEALGLEPVDHPMGAAIGTTYQAAPTGETSVAGVWAAGNVVDTSASVSNVVGTGYMAGAMINADLVDDDAARAVAAHAAHGASDGDVPVMDEAFWDARYGTADRIWSGNPNTQLVADAAGLAPAARSTSVPARVPTRSGWPSAAGRSMRSTSPGSPSSGAATRPSPVGPAWRNGSPGGGPTCSTTTSPTVRTTSCRCSSCTSRGPTARSCSAVASPSSLPAARCRSSPTILTTSTRPRTDPRCPTSSTPPTRWPSCSTTSGRWSPATPGPVRRTDPHGEVISIHDAVLVARRA